MFGSIRIIYSEIETVKLTSQKNDKYSKVVSKDMWV